MKKTVVKVTAIIAFLFILLSMVILFVGCTAADNVNHNLSQAADNFKCLRKSQYTTQERT